MNDSYVWLLWASLFLVPWGLLYAALPNQRKPMLWASILTTPFGLSEPIFVPEYWSPPSLFDLAIRTGFDVESLIFCFGIGGVAAVLYNVVTGSRFEDVDATARLAPLHRHHRLALSAPFISFPILLIASPVNPIYPGIAAMVVGAIATVLCRPDLKRQTWIGGIMFTVYYWVFVEGLEFLSPGYVERVWNLPDLSGVMILNTPLEELAFALSFGLYWAGVYGHFSWKRVTHAG